MTSDIVAVIVFVIGVIFACIAWNRYTMKRFIHPKTRNLIYDVYSGTKEKLIETVIIKFQKQLKI